jgi:hypothetical protein
VGSLCAIAATFVAPQGRARAMGASHWQHRTMRTPLLAGARGQAPHSIQTHARHMLLHIVLRPRRTQGAVLPLQGSAWAQKTPNTTSKARHHPHKACTTHIGGPSALLLVVSTRRRHVWLLLLLPARAAPAYVRPWRHLTHGWHERMACVAACASDR